MRYPARSLLSLCWMAAALLVGCPGDESGDDDSSSDDDDTAPVLAADLDADTDHDGALDGSDAEEDAEDSYPGAVVRVNVDDDGNNGLVDTEDSPLDDGEDDLALSLIQPDGLAALSDDAFVLLTLEGDVEQVRVYHDGTAILGGEGATQAELADVAGGEPTLEVEALDFHYSVTLRADLYADDQLVDEDELVLSSAPFLMFNHLDPSETLYLTKVDMWGNNVMMREGIKAAIGEENVVELDSNTYEFDVWVQDEVEFAYQQTPYGAMQMVLDSIRDRGLDPFPENELLGPDFGHLVRGSGQANSLDSFGNLECTPPVTVDGVEYPFGRIYYGGAPGPFGTRMTEELRLFLDAQEVQAPLELDSTWLYVGHVDEFMTFVPDSTSDKGFKLIYTDHGVTAEIMESLDRSMTITHFAEVGYETVGDVMDSALMDYSADVDATYLAPMLETVKEEFGLTEEDVIRIPGIWEEIWGYGVAMVPGMANLAVFDNHLLIADPFFRVHDEDIDGNGELDHAEDIDGDNELDTNEDLNGNGVLDDGEDFNENGLLDTEEDLDADWQLDEGEDLNGNGRLDTFRDPFILYMEEHMPAELELHFLDNWDWYHMGFGEVHCGTNILRTPRSDLYWWEVE